MAKFAMSALTIAGTQIYGSAESSITSANFVSISAKEVNIVNVSASVIFSNIITIDGVRMEASAAAPTVAPALRGDIVWNNTPAAGGQIGFVCVVAGTPGTWKTFGLIES